MSCLLSLITCLLAFLVVNCLQGHQQPLGLQGTSRHEVESINFTSSGSDFYRKYIRTSRPAHFQNAASLWPALKTWQNRHYLKAKYGKHFYNVDFAKRFVTEKIDQQYMPLEKFLEIYRVEDVCLESNISDSRMLEEINLPTLLQCKELHPDPRNVNIVISSGSVVAPLYQLQGDVLIVLLSGSSRVVMFDKKYTKELYKDDYFFAPHVSNVIPDQVDLQMFPEFSQMPHHVAELQPGDMLYVPRNWWLQSTSSGDHRVGVNIWFNPFDEDANFPGNDMSKDIIQATDRYDEFLDKQTFELECADRRTSLRHVLKINESDPKTLQLRIPKKNERPSDVILPSGYAMPVLGLGTALLNENTTQAVKYALKIGYRLFDSAQGYPGSESGIAKAMKESDVPRSDIFLVTKLHPRYLGYNSTLAAIDGSLESLGTSYIDLFLIHSKECDDYLLACKEGEPEGTWQETWKAMEHAQKLGKLRSLGVSNFYVSDLKELVSMAEIPVSVVQNWFDPIHQDVNVRNFCKTNNIRYMGYSTLGGMWVHLGLSENPILTSSLLTDLSTHYDYVVSHVVLRWAIHRNVTVIPRSSNENHIAQNYRALDISLAKYDIKEIDSMVSVMDDLLADMFGKTDDADKDAGGNAETGKSAEEQIPAGGSAESSEDSSAKHIELPELVARGNAEVHAKRGTESSQSEEDGKVNDSVETIAEDTASNARESARSDAGNGKTSKGEL